MSYKLEGDFCLYQVRVIESICLNGSNIFMKIAGSRKLGFSRLISGHLFQILGIHIGT